MNIYGVSGANYGDEGKGLVTDYLAGNSDNCLVVLNNGGPQRGHTVIRDGYRHVFHHLGSGTLAGADTFITNNFLVNPIIFRKELEELRKDNKYFTENYKLFIDDKIFIDNRALVTTPFHMIFNQILSRLFGKHDTCGYGIWETVRHIDDKESFMKPLSISTIIDYARGYKKLYEYLNKQRQFVEENLMGLKRVDSKYNLDLFEIEEEISNFKKISIDGLVDHWIEDIQYLSYYTYIISKPLSKFVKGEEYNDIIIENGQGLLLDKDYDKEYGTPSKTNLLGMKNEIEKIAGKNDKVEIIYVSRTYLTRHGDGNIDNEFNLDYTDKTNEHNEFQGKLRFGKLLYSDLYQRCKNDFEEADIRHNNKDWSIVLTHMDVYDIKNLIPNDTYDNNLDRIKYISDQEGELHRLLHYNLLKLYINY